MELNTGKYNIDFIEKRGDIYEFAFTFNEGDDIAYIEYNREEECIEKIDFNLLKENNEYFVDAVLNIEDKIIHIIKFLIDLM